MKIDLGTKGTLYMNQDLLKYYNSIAQPADIEKGILRFLLKTQAENTLLYEDSIISNIKPKYSGNRIDELVITATSSLENSDNAHTIIIPGKDLGSFLHSFKIHADTYSKMLSQNIILAGISNSGKLFDNTAIIYGVLSKK